MKIFDNVLAVVIGAMTGLILIVLLYKGIHSDALYPLPAGTDQYNADSLSKGVSALPTNAFILALLAYVVSSFIAGIVTTIIAKREKRNPSIVVGVILTIMGVYYIVNLHQHAWFSVASMFAYLPFTYLGYLVSRKKMKVS